MDWAVPNPADTLKLFKPRINLYFKSRHIERADQVVHILPQLCDANILSKHVKRVLDKCSEFCVRELHLINCFTAETPSVVTFVVHLFQLGYAPSSITSSVSAISYIHNIHEVADPTAAFIIRKLLQGAAKLRPLLW